MMLGRLLVALVSLAALLGVGSNAPALDVVRRTMGSLEAIATERQERPMALEESGEIVGIRVTRISRAADDPREPSSLSAMVASSDLGRFRASPSGSLRAPHPSAWVAPSPTHAELMVFLI